MKKFSFVNTIAGDHLSQLHELYKKMWWSKTRSMEEIQTMLRTSISFGLIEELSNRLVGYARVVTDEMRFALIFDVMVDEEYRGEGLGKLIMDSILSDPFFKNVKYFELTCLPDLIPYYEKFNFSNTHPVPECKPMWYKNTPKPS